MGYARYEFEPERYERELVAIITELLGVEALDARGLARVLKKHPKDGRAIFSKSDLIRGYRALEPRYGWGRIDPYFVDKLRAKPIRTESGVAPVTVLTKPFPCPGECIFCPNDVRMPKSYLSMEPGAQRAAQHAFDPYGQTFTRLRAFHNNGHRVDKVELIILGGTWSFYPERYQVWFIERCFDAMNDFARSSGQGVDPKSSGRDFKDLDRAIDGRSMDESYNSIVSAYLKRHLDGRLIDTRESSSWESLERAHAENAAGGCRCVGLVVETRPDHISEAEVIRIRRLGATKVQIGYQSLSDEILAKNARGHDVAATRRAMRLLRGAGFKIHAHWMPNLYGSTPERDVEDFARIFEDPDFRPDELKIYPCSLIESAELMKHFESGAWRPYTHEELLEVMIGCMARVPRYCRLTRVIRDIPSHDILVGNKMSNFREVAERAADARGVRSADIRAREIRCDPFDPGSLSLVETEYETSVGREHFLEIATAEDRLVGFLRLALPRTPSFVAEIGESAIIREVHVYGLVAGLGERGEGKAQHLGLGRRLIDRASSIAAGAGYRDLAVISSIGTREYYGALGFETNGLYQHRSAHPGRDRFPIA
jgi:elongator complex protein 3 (tRNA carboxymethyluridine synthase)